MSIYYIEDKNGDYFSTDKKRRFIKLTGKQAFIYLKQHRGKRFYKTTTEEENGEKVFIEIPPDKVKQSRREERHEQYVDDCKNDADIQVVSLNDSVSPDNDVLIEESISSNEDSVENMVVSNLEFETLHKAIQSLNMKEKHQELIKDNFYNAVINHEKPICPKCGKVGLFVLQDRLRNHIVLFVRMSAVGLWTIVNKVDRKNRKIK